MVITLVLKVVDIRLW